MDIDQWSHDSQAFKTITSGSETRNQTSSKKYGSKNKNIYHHPSHHPTTHNISVEDLQNQLKYLQDMRQKQIMRKNYVKVAQMNKKLNRIKQQINKIQQNINKSVQEQEQYAIYQKHEQEMAYFQQKWSEIFQKFRRKQQICMVRLEVQQQKQARQVYQNLNKKIEKIDMRCFKDKQLIQLQKLQRELFKKQRYEDLIKLKLKQKKKQIKQKLIENRNNEIKKLSQIQQKKLRQKYDKKFSSLKIKLNQCKEYQLKIYQKNEEMLKRKFMNSINKLQHNSNMRRSRCISAHK